MPAAKQKPLAELVAEAEAEVLARLDQPWGNPRFDERADDDYDVRDAPRFVRDAGLAAWESSQ